MKKIKTGILLLFVLAFSSSCKHEPTTQEVQNNTKMAVEELLTEDNTRDQYIRMDRYFIAEHPTSLVYTGAIKCTMFYTRLSIGGVELDSLKLYRDVEIKFQSKDYDTYLISIKARE